MLSKTQNTTIPFHRVKLFNEELNFVEDVLKSTNPKGNGVYTKKCHQFFQDKFGMKNAYLTTSCSTALEMAALLLKLTAGDEVIVPSYTYITTASSFVLHGAKIVFVDSLPQSPNVDPNEIRKAITINTKAIVVVHYGGIAADMEQIMEIAREFQIPVIEDAAHGIDAYYKDQPLGSLGHMSVFSFHQTKNISSGHGGMLIINDESFLTGADEVWDKGTNKASFDKGNVDFYSWTALGSSFYPPEIVAAALYGQLLNLEMVTQKRSDQWKYYHDHLSSISNQILLPETSEQKTNGHIYYLKLSDPSQRDPFIAYLGKKGICASTHYRCLHRSDFINSEVELPHAQKWEDCLVRLPLYHELSEKNQNYIVKVVQEYDQLQ
jgi:dTDP-4-amino-4,6-dideoxygalactose transaminase